MKMRNIIPFLLLLFTLSAQAQSVISGWVTDKTDKKPVTGVVITLLDNEGETVAYAITKADGSFSISLNSDLPKLTLHARLLGYEDYKREIENKTRSFSIEMSFGEIELREVVVKSRPMWKREDTLVYSVDAFKSLGDKTIGDLLKKLPGVEVSESGGIKYQGEAINKFYIEGLDLLERRYGIATNNVPVDAVQNVEIIENHEPVKALRDVLASDKAAINLKLKKDKMGRPVGNITLGTGVSDEWLRLAEAFALNAAKKRQYVAMYKTNNSSKDITTELTAQTLSATQLQDASDFSPKKLLNPRGFSSPPVEKKRYLFNNSHVASVNNLWKIGENNQLRANLQYLHDAVRETINRNNEYFLPDSIMHIREYSLISQRSNMLDAALTYTGNNTGYYLNNMLKWKGNWDKASSSVKMNAVDVKQYFDLPSHIIQNNFQYINRKGKNIWDITSYAVYSSQPQTLTVDVDTVETNQIQQATLSGFYTHNSTYYGWGKGRSSIIFKIAIEGSLDRLQSELNHPVFTDTTRSKITADYVNLEFIPAYTYQHEGFTLNADVTLRQHTLRVKNRVYNSDDTYNFSFGNPSLKLSYRLTPMMNIRAGYRYTHSVGDFMDVTDTYFMSGYRNFSKRSGVLAQGNRQTINGGLQYRNPLTSFFFNTSISYSLSESNLINSQRFVGTESVVGNRPYNTESNMLLWQGYVGKYFAGIRTNVSLSANYNDMKGQRLQQGVLYPHRFSGWTFMPKANVKVSDNCAVTYQSVLSDGITKFTRGDKTFRSSIWQITQQLSGFYLIGKQWQLNARAEHSYNEVGEDNTVNMFFADLGITYKHKKMDFDLAWNNIFNQDRYSYSSYNGLDRFDYVYNLRPAMLMFTMSFKY